MAPEPLAEPEAYQSLYRRYRPRRFEEVRGQEAVTRALRNAVREGRVAHAYLFSGPRGTGKTSTARILAMALNCEHQSEGEPDGTCESCVEIRRGASVDVHELDAASNRKIEEMRSLLARVSLGTPGRWKVYIVDEVHQLTADAASALLKTLEEPPAHVVFVLATTDPQRVLPTIKSRTQHYEFKLLGSEVLGGLLRDVNSAADLGVATDAMDLVLRRGNGSARDALSVLDQVAAAGSVEDEGFEVGTVVDALADRDVSAAMTAVASGINAGRDPRTLGSEIVAYLRNGFLTTQARQLVMLGDDDAAEAESRARRLGLPALVRAMEVIGQALIDMRESVDPRVTLEVALVRLSAPEADTSPAAIVERLAALEQGVASGASPAASTPGRQTPAGSTPGRQTPAGSTPGRQTPAGSSAPAPPGKFDRSRVARQEPRTEPRQGPTEASPGGDERPGGAPSPRATLGAHRRGRPPAAGGAPQSQQVAPRAPQTSPPGPQSAAADSAKQSTAVDSPAPAGSGWPSRDDLTAAWGDKIVPQLPPAVKAYLGAGRWVAVEGDFAVFGLPDAPLVVKAEAVKGKAEDALEAHFGRRIPMRLVHDTGGAPPVEASPEAHDDAVSEAHEVAPGVQATHPTGEHPLPSGRPQPPARPDASAKEGKRPPPPAPPPAPPARPAPPSRPASSSRPAPPSKPAPTARQAPTSKPSPKTDGHVEGQVDEEDPGSYDLDQLEDAGSPLVSPEQRLFNAFPGAQEVDP